LKRVRRIEVIRYSRRFTETQGDPVDVDRSAERQTDDLILNALQGIPPTIEQGDFDESGPNDVPADRPRRSGSLVSLGELLRLRGRR